MPLWAPSHVRLLGQDEVEPRAHPVTQERVLHARRRRLVRLEEADLGLGGAPGRSRGFRGSIVRS